VIRKSESLRKGLSTGGTETDPTVVGYSDAAESNHPRLLAQTGVVVKRSGGPIIFYSHRQKLTKLSIADAEMVALNDLVGDLLHVANIHDEVTLPIKRPIQAWTDNEALSKRVNGMVVSYENRFVQQRDYFCKDQVNLGNVSTNWKRGKDNPADMFTKPLSFVPFYKHCEGIGMRAIIIEGNCHKVVKLSEVHEKLRNKN
jgi:hypothetical protein